MHWILILPDILPAGYPANVKVGYRISGQCKSRIPVPVYGRVLNVCKSRVLNIQLDIWWRPDTGIRPYFQLNIQRT
jgi:hypothetical protein